MKRKKLLLSLTMFLIMFSFTPTKAATQYPPEGGTWQYGYSTPNAYSHYLHSTKPHQATVVDNIGNSNTSRAIANYWARASVRGWHDCSFYYAINV